MKSLSELVLVQLMFAHCLILFRHWLVPNGLRIIIFSVVIIFGLLKARNPIIGKTIFGIWSFFKKNRTLFTTLVFQLHGSVLFQGILAHFFLNKLKGNYAILIDLPGCHVLFCVERDLSSRRKSCRKIHRRTALLRCGFFCGGSSY